MKDTVRKIGENGGWATLVTVMVLGCRGPERAPHQPITGVDTPREQAVLEDVPEGAGDGAGESLPSATSERTPTAPMGDHWLDRFVDGVAAEASGDVAIFPALTRGDDGAVLIDGLGDYLAEETASRLVGRGVRALAGKSLEVRLREVGRSHGDYRDEWTALELGRDLGVRHVVTGSYRIAHLGRRLDRHEWIEIDWRCHDLDQSRDVVRVRPEIDTEPEFQRLVARSEQPASRPGEGFEPSIADEMQRLASKTLDRLLAKLGASNGELRVAVLPTVLPALRSPERRALEFAVEFQKAYAEIAGRVPAAEVLDQPATVGSAHYPTLAAALDEYRVLRDELERSSAGQVGEWISRQLFERLEAAAGYSTVLSPWDRSRDALLFVIQDEAARVRSEGSVDEDSIGFLQTQGSQAVLRSEMEELPGGELALTLTFLTIDPVSKVVESSKVASLRQDAVRATLSSTRGGRP